MTKVWIGIIVVLVLIVVIVIAVAVIRNKNKKEIPNTEPTEEGIQKAVAENYAKLSKDKKCKIGELVGYYYDFDSYGNQKL